MAPSVQVIPRTSSSHHEMKTITSNKVLPKDISNDYRRGNNGFKAELAATTTTEPSSTTMSMSTNNNRIIPSKSTAMTTTLTRKTNTTKDDEQLNQINHGNPNARALTVSEPTGFSSSSIPNSMHPINYPVNPNTGSLYPGNMYYGGSGALGMYGMMSPYSGMYPPSFGPLATWNQYLMGIQNFVFSVGQVVQVSNNLSYLSLSLWSQP
jgi:hypothetical protein